MKFHLKNGSVYTTSEINVGTIYPNLDGTMTARILDGVSIPWYLDGIIKAEV